MFLITSYYDNSKLYAALYKMYIVSLKSYKLEWKLEKKIKFFWIYVQFII